MASCTRPVLLSTSRPARTSDHAGQQAGEARAFASDASLRGPRGLEPAHDAGGRQRHVGNCARPRREAGGRASMRSAMRSPEAVSTESSSICRRARFSRSSRVCAASPAADFSARKDAPAPEIAMLSSPMVRLQAFLALAHRGQPALQHDAIAQAWRPAALPGAISTIEGQGHGHVSRLTLKALLGSVGAFDRLHPPAPRPRSRPGPSGRSAAARRGSAVRSWNRGWRSASRSGRLPDS